MDIEEEDFSELCAEILENWTCPINFDLGQNPLHQYPFSLKSPIYPQQLSNAYGDEYVKKVEINSINSPQVSCSTNLVTKGETIDMAHNKNYEKGSKCEQAEKRFNDPIIPVLVADTFFDKVLGHGVDGVDVAALNKVKEVKECDKFGDKSRTILNENGSFVSVSNGKEMEKLNFARRLSGFKCNSSTVDKMPNRSFISYENRCTPATSVAARTRINGAIAKSKFSIPSNKTIFDVDIDKIEEKPWRNLGVDTSDFFNYGLDEKQWKDYCKLMEWRSETKVDTGVDECVPFSLNGSDVIIEIVMHDSFHENGLRQVHINKDDVLTNNANTQSVNCRMITGDKISPFPMDCDSSYSTEYGEIEQLCKRSCGKEIVKIVGFDQMEMEYFSRNENRHFLSCFARSNQKKVRFNVGSEKRKY